MTLNSYSEEEILAMVKEITGGILAIKSSEIFSKSLLD